MHDWKERRSAGEAAWEPWYQPDQWDKPAPRKAPRIWHEHSCLGSAPALGAVVGAPPATLDRPDNPYPVLYPNLPEPTGEGASRNTRGACAPRKLLLTPPEIAELDRKDAAELLDYLLANPLRSVINGGREYFDSIVNEIWNGAI